MVRDGPLGHVCGDAHSGGRGLLDRRDNHAGGDAMRLPVGVGTMHLAAEFEHLRFAAFANRGNQLSGRILDMHCRRFSERERPHLLVGVPGGEHLGGQRVVAGGGAADKVRQGP